MSKIPHKPYDQMTAAELREATKAFDPPFAALDQARPLTARQKDQHRRARRRGRPPVGLGAEKIRISVERGLLERVDAYAKRANLGRSELIAEALELRLRDRARAGA